MEKDHIKKLISSLNKLNLHYAFVRSELNV